MEIKDVIKTGLDLTKRSLDRTLDGLTYEELKLKRSMIMFCHTSN